MARTTNGTERIRCANHCGTAVAPGDIVAEVTAHEDATVARVQRDESATAPSLPVVVVDGCGGSLASGCPDAPTVPFGERRLEIDRSLPARRAEATRSSGHETDNPVGAHDDTGSCTIDTRERSDETEHLELDR